jgi:transposase-like protein
MLTSVNDKVCVPLHAVRIVALPFCGSSNNQSIAGLAKEEGISDATLYNWRQHARNEGRLKAALETQPD